MNADATSARLRILAQRSPVRDRLVTMLFLTALLHAIIILGITFTAGSEGSTSRGLEVLLVTNDLAETASNERAPYIAQRSQQGSGNARDQPTSTPATQAAPQPEQQQSAREAGGTSVLATTAPQPLIRYIGSAEQEADADVEAPNIRGESAQAGRGEGAELVLRGDPRTGQWLSPDTRASKLAPWLDGWRRKVERLGTLNYPTAARDFSQSGSPVIEVAIRADGRLLEARLQRSSGHGALDQAALNILRLASPFDPFPRELAADYNVLRFAYQWEFVAGRAAAGSVTAGTDEPTRP